MARSCFVYEWRREIWLAATEAKRIRNETTIFFKKTCYVWSCELTLFAWYGSYSIISIPCIIKYILHIGTSYSRWHSIRITLYTIPSHQHNSMHLVTTALQQSYTSWDETHCINIMNHSYVSTKRVHWMLSVSSCLNSRCRKMVLRSALRAALFDPCFFVRVKIAPRMNMHWNAPAMVYEINRTKEKLTNYSE